MNTAIWAFCLASVLLGLGVWLPQLIYPSESYPVGLHFSFLFNGLVVPWFFFIIHKTLYSLMELPRPRPFELIIITLLALGAVYFGWSDRGQTYIILSATQLLFTLVSLGHKILRAPYGLPLPYSLAFCSLVASLNYILLSFNKGPYYLEALTSLSLGCFLSLGAQFYPGSLGQEIQDLSSRGRFPRGLMIFAPVFLILPFLPSLAADFYYIGLILFLTFSYFSLGPSLKDKGPFQWSVIGSWSLCFFSLLLNLVWREERVHALHLFFVGPFIMHFLIFSGRLTRPKSLAYKKKIIYFIGFLITLAAVTRSYAPVIERIYFSHLGHSAGLAMIGIIIAVFFWRRYV